MTQLNFGIGPTEIIVLLIIGLPIFIIWFFTRKKK